jgi:hypothetical protein
MQVPIRLWRCSSARGGCTAESTTSSPRGRPTSRTVEAPVTVFPYSWLLVSILTFKCWLWLAVHRSFDRFLTFHRPWKWIQMPPIEDAFATKATGFKEGLTTEKGIRTITRTRDGMCGAIGACAATADTAGVCNTM